MTNERPRWTREAPDVRRRQLLDAARLLISESSYEEMTVAAVAERAGVGKGTVYLYFDSKSALLAGLRDLYWERMLGIIHASLSDDTVPRAERLSGMVAALAEHLIAEMDLYHSLFHDAPAVDPAPRGDFVGLIADFISEGISSGEFDIGEPQITATFLVNALLGTGRLVAHAPADRRPALIRALQSLSSRAVGLG